MRRAEVVVVTGAPGSGKTTYVKQRAEENDAVFDFDKIAGAIVRSGRPGWMFGVIRQIRALLLEVRGPATVWIVGTMPRRFEKEFYARKYNARVLTVDPGIEAVKKNIENDTSREDKEKWRALVDDYYESKERYDEEEIITAFYAGGGES